MNKFILFWRRRFCWFPVQFCMVCGKAYWAGLPRFEFENKLFADGSEGSVILVTWMPWWSDYCSRACAGEDIERIV